LRSALRIFLTIVFSLVTCGLTLLGLLVVRDAWLLLGGLHIPGYALFNLIDKALLLIAGIVTLAVIIYSLESYANTEIMAHLWQRFLRVLAAQICFLGICHAILAITEASIGIGGSSAIVLPVVEILIGTGLYSLNRRYRSRDLARGLVSKRRG